LQRRIEQEACPGVVANTGHTKVTARWFFPVA
jgi:hypothetical protein